MVKMYSLVAGAGCCGCSNVCGTNVEVALEHLECVGADGSFPLPCFGCCLEVSQACF